MNETLKEQIINLQIEGKTRPEICKMLNCTKSTVCYHLTNGQKEKTRLRTIKRRNKHPYIKKIENFRGSNQTNRKQKNLLHKWKKLISLKIQGFHTNRETDIMESLTFTVQDVIEKFGENPTCYLTGDKINIYEPRTYAFDHINPVSRGGTNDINNLGTCTRAANQAKSDLTLDEFYELCEKVHKIKNKL